MQEVPKTDAYHQDSYSNEMKNADIKTRLLYFKLVTVPLQAKLSR